MAAPIEYYVDPSGTVDSGDGSALSPWTPRTGPTKSAIQHALDTITRDATNGDRINVKAGASADVQTAALSFATYGTPGLGAELWLQGYTSTAGDGGVGKIDLNNGSYSLATSRQYMHLIDLDVSNNNVAGGQYLINAQYGSHVIRCEVHDGSGGITAVGAMVISCHVYDINVTGINMSTSSYVWGNYISNAGTEEMDEAIVHGAGECVRNIISIDGATDGIKTTNHWTAVSNNSIFCTTGTGTGRGIWMSGNKVVGVFGNLIEGFNGSGGIGIDASGSSTADPLVSNNAIYNCATNINAADHYSFSEDNESLGASPFAKSGANTFANRATYFAPVDTGNVRTGGLHGQFKGAVAPAVAGGGGGGGGAVVNQGIHAIESGIAA
jgi:hypothetical protein